MPPEPWDRAAPPHAVAEFDRLGVFVPGRVVSPNHVEWWGTRARRVQRTRDAVCAAILAAVGRRRFVVPPERPKRILFRAFVKRFLDDDNLQGAVKPFRDGLQDAGVIRDDSPRDGHAFAYEQVVAGGRLAGVWIEITLRPRVEGDG
jgi:hypothetical protein